MQRYSYGTTPPEVICRERSALLMTWDAYRDDIRKAKAKLTA